MREIPLANGRGVALVDDADYELVSQYRWRLDPFGYAIRGVRRPDGTWTKERMHTFLLGRREGYTVDHRNRNPLDNRENNLRWATATEQQRNKGRRADNTSGYIGVSWDEGRSRW